MEAEMKNLNLYQTAGKLIKDMFSKQEVICGIEIGTKCGDLTRAVLWALPQVQLYTIDPYEHRDGAEFEAGEPQDYHNENRRFAESRLLLPEFGERVCMLVMKSVEAHKWIKNKNPDKLFDFVLVDGDHSEEGIKKDIELFYPLVREGGFFLMHDVGLVHPLTEIVEECFGEKLNKSSDFTAWVVK
jgi:hypothetical protein